MLVSFAQYQGTVGTFNNRNIVPKIEYSLLTCRFFRKLNRNVTFLILTVLCSVTLILSPSPYKYKNYLLVSSKNSFDSYRHNVYSNCMGTCFTN